jgi:hypothetical protein
VPSEKLDGLEKSFNLERDLQRSDYIVERVKEYDYAQALYAALCNNEWIPKDTMSLLKNEGQMVSWRYAGGIVSRLRGSGDYMDFYCSGHEDNCVEEGKVTNEIKRDLSELGWVLKRD